MMKKLLLTITAVSALAAAAPASAQYSSQSNVNAGGSVGVDNRIARLEARIQAGIQSGAIDRMEARSLRQQLRDIRRLDRQYSVNGLSQQERADLQQRVRTFRDQLRLADGRGNGYAQQGAYNQGYSGQGGPYQEVECESSSSSSGSRGVLGGLFDSIFGGGSSGGSVDCGLGVGQRATGNLGAVPYQYRNQYRDGGGVYYRSDGRSIYQIDARTDTVVRVYGMNR